MGIGCSTKINLEGQIKIDSEGFGKDIGFDREEKWHCSTGKGTMCREFS